MMSKKGTMTEEEGVTEEMVVNMEAGYDMKYPLLENAMRKGETEGEIALGIIEEEEIAAEEDIVPKETQSLQGTTEKEEAPPEEGIGPRDQREANQEDQEIDHMELITQPKE